ncbi:ammonia-forming cytochrome c nitrite reductase subunit c552 [Slackia heliotrinireducens]|uniref:ammonia-forming cytochrome c nitrite reductase subunit c552 n=1 Tax=Slackia heliotrinireducens TaxID=84110 RepID=UPI00331543FF
MLKTSAWKKGLAWVCAGAFVVSLAAATACAPTATSEPTEAEEAGDAAQTVTYETPEPDEYGVVTAEQWKDIYPNQYATYVKNKENQPVDYAEENGPTEDTTTIADEGYDAAEAEANAAEKVSYLDTNPEIKILGLGYGYAKYYTEPAGHVYSLWTVTHNGRISEKSGAGCWACKTPQFSNYVDENGNEVFKEKFLSMDGWFTEGISCASCHANDPTGFEIDRAQWKDAMGADVDTVPMESVVCGQCHCDYSMAPETGIPTSPYTGGLESMSPENALKFYDDNNFVDWTYESTGAQMLAIRHAEFEFNYANGGSPMVNMINQATGENYTCNDCHMGKATAEDGTEYTNHQWTVPTENEELIAENCSMCHKDLAGEIKAIQDEIMASEHEVGLRACLFIFNFEDAIEAGTLTDDQIAELQYIQRAACYYWNLEAAENSEGAHNPDFSRELIASANEWLDKGDEILGVSSVVDDVAAAEQTVMEHTAA